MTPQGSHQTRGGWEPKTCSICGQRAPATRPGPGIWFHYCHTTHQGYAWHIDCYRRRGMSEVEHTTTETETTTIEPVEPTEPNTDDDNAADDNDQE